jgi:nitroreductase
MKGKKFFQVLEERRSVRKFNNTKIDKAMIKKIIDICDSSPSAGGLQSFEIYYIDNLEIKNQIVKASMDQEFIAEAPLLLVFCANPTRSSKYGKKAELFSIQDATIATSYAQLTACALGLSSVWVGAFNEGKVSTILSLPDNIIPIALLPIGYKDEEPQMKITRGSKEIVHKLK